MSSPRVAVVCGSTSDLEVMAGAGRELERFGVPFERFVTSAHRAPARTREWAAGLEARGVRVVIAGAGMAAHLAGVLAAELTLPVIAVPIAASPLGGLDALLSTVQMPGGVPVATVAIGAPGAKNAGLLAVQILATGDDALRAKLAAHKLEQAQALARDAAALCATGS